MSQTRMSPTFQKRPRFAKRLMGRSALLFSAIAIAIGSSTALSPTSAGPQLVTSVTEIPAAFLKATPSSIEELQQIEDHVAVLIDQVKPATVGVQVGRAFGSGVIVSADGYILTAGHVSGEAGRAATITLADGRRFNARTLGAREQKDSGMLKIIAERTDWPYAELAPRDEIRRGDWCAVLGHPGGVQQGRSAVLRLGRVLRSDMELIQTDCELVGGDSGGPLFDMKGRVIGINSRIAERTDMNFHVHVGMYESDWDRLVAGEMIAEPTVAYLGVIGKSNPDGAGLLITEVVVDSAAEEAGFRTGDVLLRYGDRSVATIDELQGFVRAESPGQRVVIAVERAGKVVKLKARLKEFRTQ